MAIILPHREETHLTHYHPPKGDYTPFSGVEHYNTMVKSWGLGSGSKKEFWYKGRGYQRIVTLEGYESYGVTAEYYTLVIRFQDGNLSCIHPAYLKEMQSSQYGKELNEGEDVQEVIPADKAEEVPSSETKKEKPKKVKEPALNLPEEKVSFTAMVEKVVLTYNPFNEENDEALLLKEVIINGEEPMEVGYAWCSYSKTLKKFEVAPGDRISFDAKIAKKKLPKGKDVEEEHQSPVAVPYKINNPSKLVKQ